MDVYLQPSSRRDKKYQVTINDVTIHFGAAGYGDFIKYWKTNHDLAERKKASYLARHHREDWNDVYTAGFWARWLLWNKPTLDASIKDIERRFDLSIETSA